MLKLSILLYTLAVVAAKPQNAADETSKESQPCTTDRGEQGFCVKYYLCSPNQTINYDGTGLLDVRNAGSSKSKRSLPDSNFTDVDYSLGNRSKRQSSEPCESYLQTCCKVPAVEAKPPSQPPTVQRKSCGWSNPNGKDYQIEPSLEGFSKFAEFPWMAGILQEYVGDLILNIYVGGGSLIHPRVVLAAAHFVANDEMKFIVRAGEWDTQSKKEKTPHEDRRVTKIVTHKDFNRNNLHYDVALLFLESPMPTAENIAPICLPDADEAVPVGTKCFASGWGKNEFGAKGRYSTFLKKVELPVVDHAECQKLLRKTRLDQFFQLHHSFMCAGGQADKDTCTGDGGSPLVCPVKSGENRYVQTGIVAWGIGCGNENVPGVYVDVASLRGWIDEQLAKEGISLSAE